jgi:hypothetical protein
LSAWRFERAELLDRDDDISCLDGYDVSAHSIPVTIGIWTYGFASALLSEGIIPMVSPPSLRAPLHTASITPVRPPHTTAAPLFAISAPTSSARVKSSPSAWLEPMTPTILNPTIHVIALVVHKVEPVCLSAVRFSSDMFINPATRY